MRRRWTGLFAICLLATFVGAGRVLAQAPDLGPDRYVVVQRVPKHQALHADGSPPTLAEEGFESIPVPVGVSTADFLASLRAQPGVISAEEDGHVYAADIPNDPFYLRDQAAYLTQVGAPQAWALATGSNTVIVAVLDTGLDLAHPEFAGRLWENTADAYTDGLDHDGNGCVNDRYGCRFINFTRARQSICGYTDSRATGAVLDDDSPKSGGAGSHGTMVSGVIGAAGDNGIGITGVAWNVRLMTVKVLDCGSGFGGAPVGDVFNVAQGIEYAVRNGARIINLSLASPPDDPSANSAALRKAIQLAQDAGVIIVAAAGNHRPGDSNVAPGYPAAYTEYPNVVAVGASDNLNGNTWATYSNYGPSIDLAAPGNKIVSTVRSDIGWATPYGQIGNPEDGYAGGTSFATPLVSGMFALMISRNSRLPGQDYVNLAKAAATPAPPAPHGQNWAGAGIINMGDAVARVPLSITGAALRDWRDAPPGADIRAFVDGTECGATTSSSFGVVSNYTIVVRSAAQQTGCGIPGKTVQLTIAGQAAYPTFTWGGKNEDLAIVRGGDISTISPSPGGIIVQSLGPGWSNIASFEPTGPAVGSLASLPLPWSAAYHWNSDNTSLSGAAGAYDRFVRNAPAAVSDWLTVNQYDAFWVDAPAGAVASVNPSPAPGRVIQLKQGWNNFVYTGTSRKVSEALAEIGGRYTEVLQYDNANRQWLVYIPGQPRYLEDFGGLFKFKTYWIYMSQPGSITMN